MSHREGDKFVIEQEPEGECEYCGKVAELRPYGKNGAKICFECGMKNIEETNKNFGKVLKDCKLVIDKTGGNNLC